MAHAGKPLTAGPGSRLDSVEAYKDVVAGVLRAVPRETIDLWSVFRDDALALSYIFDCIAADVAVLDVGTFVGVSAFLCASQPRVAHVTTVDPNPKVVDELADTGSIVPLDVGSAAEIPSDLRVHDVARKALLSFPAEAAKIDLRTGVIAGESSSGVRVDIPDPGAFDAQRLVAFVDGLHTTAAVRADANAIFDSQPDALVFLDDCRYFWGPFVQAGVAGVLEDRRHQIRFKMIADVGVSLATCTLGLLYGSHLHDEVEEMLLSAASQVLADRGALHPLFRDPHVTRVESERDSAVAQIKALENELRRMRASKSWRMTAPLRKLGSRTERAGE